MVHIYNEILLSHKKDQNNAICSKMDATRDYHTKGSKSEKWILYVICMWNLKSDTNESMKWKQNHELREQLTGDCQREGACGGGGTVSGRLRLTDVSFYI